VSDRERACERQRGREREREREGERERGRERERKSTPREAHEAERVRQELKSKALI